MREQPAPSVLKLLAHDLRWTLLQQLTRSDYRVAELVAQVKQPLNLVSYHLRQLRQAGLVHERRSTADERSFYYSLDLQRLHTLYLEASSSLHPSLGEAISPAQRTQWHFDSPPPRLLFLCTSNSARSQMAEALVGHLSQGQVQAFSAGSHPAQAVHPLAMLAHRVLHEIHGAPEKGLVGVSLCKLEPSARPRGRYEYNLNNEKVPKNFLERNLTPFALLEACLVVLFARVRYTQADVPSSDSV
ncbi:ArsR family transcriptional regulator [Ktedonobacter racemifer]|nr:ArsR family transcriptional regulator [Ktedonobacter racemifer]